MTNFFFHFFIFIKKKIIILEGRYLLKSTTYNLLLNLTLEYFYFYFYLFKMFLISTSHINILLFKKFFKVNKFINLYFNNFPNYPIFKNFLDIKFKHKIEYNLPSIKLNAIVNPLNKINYFPLTYFKLFNLFFLFNYSIFNFNFKFNFRFNFFLITEFKKKIILVNINKFFSRWIDSYNIFYNIFYYNFSPLVFGSSLMKNEILAINWYHSKFSINLWNYYFPFFIFKLNNYNKKSEYFFEKLFYTNINFFIIIDTIFHYKNLHYFNKYNYYTIGLVDASVNPSLVSFPILNFFNNYNIQIFFFNLIIFIQKSVHFNKFCYLKKLWLQFYLNNSFLIF